MINLIFKCPKICHLNLPSFLLTVHQLPKTPKHVPIPSIRLFHRSPDFAHCLKCHRYFRISSIFGLVKMVLFFWARNYFEQIIFPIVLKYGIMCMNPSPGLHRTLSATFGRPIIIPYAFLHKNGRPNLFEENFDSFWASFFGLFSA